MVTAPEYLNWTDRRRACGASVRKCLFQKKLTIAKHLASFAEAQGVIGPALILRQVVFDKPIRIALGQAGALALALSCAVLFSAGASGADLRLPVVPKEPRQESSPPENLKRLFEEFLRWRRSLPPRRE